MKTFNYKILKGSKVVFKNIIHGRTKEEVLAKLESVKLEYEGTEIKLVEINPSSIWSCYNMVKLKQVKLNADVKAELDSLKYYENDSYSTVIKRLIEENKQLKEDKAKLFELLINKDGLDLEGTNSEKVYSFLLATDNIKANAEEEVELQVLEIYLQDIIKTDPASVIDAVDMLIKTTSNKESISTLEKFKNYVKTSS